MGSNPRHPQAWLALARLERAQGHLGTAEQYARRALATAPYVPEVYVELAWVLVQAGRTDAGLTALASGLALAPDDPDLLRLRQALLAAASVSPHAQAQGEAGGTATSPDLHLGSRGGAPVRKADSRKPRRI